MKKSSATHSSGTITRRLKLTATVILVLVLVYCLLPFRISITQVGVFPEPPEIHRLMTMDAPIDEIETAVRAAPRDSLNTSDPDLGTPLHLAALSSRPDIIQLLLDAGANPDIQFSVLGDVGVTPMHYAVRRADYDSVKLLLKGGANPNILAADTPVFGDVTPLHLAVALKDYRLTKLLLDEGADWRIVSKTQGTAYELASKENYTKIADLIESYRGIQEPSSKPN